MKTQYIPKHYQHTSPAGVEVRVLMNNEHGGMAHCTLKNKKISKAVQHKTVSEFWHVLSGKGAIWRKKDDDESVTLLEQGMTIDIPLGTHFQYRSDDGDLVFICDATLARTRRSQLCINVLGAYTMKIAHKSEAIERKNSDVCIITEYPKWDEMIDFVVIHIHGRYPEKQRAVNVLCKEIVYVHEGQGFVNINGENHLLKPGDLVLIESGEKFYWDGEMTLFISCRPAFHIEQHQLVD